MAPPDLDRAPTHADHDALIAPLLAGRPGGGALTVAVMVTSVDGRATSGGRVGALTGEADQWLLLGVREQADALLIGAGTLRAEGYGGLLPEEARARRARRGQTAQPHLYVLARDLAALEGAEAISPGGPPLTILHPPQAELGGRRLPEHVRTRTAPALADGRPDLAAVLGTISREHPQAQLIASEGGPTLLGMLVEQRALDQLIVAISPRIEGGAEKRLIELAARIGCPVRLEGAVAAGGFAFLRYALGGR
jgi:riboflavin biosynthesis pyrimidine reductase